MEVLRVIGHFRSSIVICGSGVILKYLDVETIFNQLIIIILILPKNIYELSIECFTFLDYYGNVVNEPKSHNFILL